MSNPYIGEIRMVGFNFAPQGWAFCNGATLSIAQFDVLYNLIGTTYGGDGISTFNLPNLLGRMPVHQGGSLIVGGLGGAENVTLTVGQLPAHSHTASANTNTTAGAAGNNPAGSFWNKWPGAAFLNPSNTVPDSTMNPAALGMTGGNQPHDNMPPFLALNFIISLFGIYPSQS